MIENPHAVPAAEVAEALHVDPSRGLDESAVSQLRQRFGENRLSAESGRRWWHLVRDQFTNVVVGLLLAAALISFLTRDRFEALAILVVLVLNATIGFVTEFQAGRALEALRTHLRTTARVRRSGSERVVDAAELVPGDVVILQAGDRVPADARLLDAANLRADESTLTGESAPVSKQVDAVVEDAELADRRSMVYLGSTVVAGRGTAIVAATGGAAELGRIGRLVRDTERQRTPLERRLDSLGRRLVLVVLIIAAVVIATGLARGEDRWEMIEVGISLAVAAVPEGLPAVTTLILAIGVLRMARKRAVVRKLPAVETLGSTTVICSDKTGTLTLNRMTVREYALASGERLTADGGASPAVLERLLRVGALCNDAIAKENETIGDPTEIALVESARRLGIDVNRLREEWPRVGEQPFDSATKKMLTEHDAPAGSRYLAVKGAPGVIVEESSAWIDAQEAARTMDAEARERFLGWNKEMAGRAMRVLAFADGESPERLGFLGFAGLIDPPRPEAADAVRQAQAAGIRVVMLTGDQATTARAVARELRLAHERELLVVEARELRDISPERLAELAMTADVFARVSPEDKLNIVEAMRNNGEVVAVTGDGVNDAPALKRADIGVAMGERGTEVAREAADIVLTDDNFATIVEAVRGGRTIYANIVKFVHMMFSHNLGEVLVVFVAILLGWPLPLLPLQILWVNLVTDVFPAMALALEPSSPRLMTQAPRSPNESLLDRGFLLTIAWQAAMLAAIVLSGYWSALDRHGEGAQARAVALLMLIAVQLGHAFNCRSRTHSAFERVLENPFLWLAVVAVGALQLAALWTPSFRRVLQVRQPDATDWMLIAVAAIAPIAIVEIQKLVSRRLRRRSR